MKEQTKGQVVTVTTIHEKENVKKADHPKIRDEIKESRDKLG